MATKPVKEIGRLDRARVHIVAEDSIEFDTPFLGRFGFSALLELENEAGSRSMLYDTNSDAEPILHNMEIMGLDIQAVSTIFLSHCHYDHSDGLPGILGAIRRPVPVIAHPETFRPCFEINPDGIRHIGIVDFDRGELESLGGIMTLSRSPLNLATGVITTGEIERVSPFEQLEDLYTMRDGQVVQDPERDDSAIILNLREGLVIITGCCHAGIVNTLRHAREITGIADVYAVIGGLHLIDANEEKIEKSIAALRDVQWVFAGHCTGSEAIHRLTSELGERFFQIHTGSRIRLPVEDPGKPIETISTAQRAAYRRPGREGQIG